MLEKLKEMNKIINNNFTLLDLNINENLENILKNDLVEENIYKNNYNELHNLVKDLYFKDNSNIDLYNLGMIAINEVVNRSNKSLLELLLDYENEYNKQL